MAKGTKAKDTKKENPLLSKNIPRPPSATVESQTEANNGRTVEGENDSTIKGQNGKTVERQKGKTVDEQVNTAYREEKATIEVSLYLRPRQDDKLDELQQAYKKRTGKRIHRNDLMRKLIERATVEDIL